jgi:hypothetical protein
LVLWESLAGASWVRRRDGFAAPPYFHLGTKTRRKGRRELRTPPMAASTFLAGAVDELAEAQKTIDEHVISAASGRCIMCDLAVTCPPRESAMGAFARARRLPRRRPGASRPQLIGARRVG